MKKRMIGLLMAAVMMAGLSGCDLSGDVFSGLQPPKLTGDQQEIQQALDAYLSANGQTNARMKYPRRGDHRAAVSIFDLDGDGAKEAVAFYTTATSENVRLHLMHRDEKGKWATTADIEGVSAEIDKIGLMDVDGDGATELLCGWQLYSGKEKQLSVYSASEDGGVAAVGGDTLYTEFVIGRFTGANMEDLLILRADTAVNEVTVSLATAKGGILTADSTVHLDGYIQSFSGIHLSTVALSESGQTAPALYIDCVKGNLQFTELVVWDGMGLVAPFYNANTNVSTAIVREVSLTATDMDGDGVLEVPSCSRLPGYEMATAGASMWLTVWNRWKLTEQWTVEEIPAFYCIMNTADGYYFRMTKPFLSDDEEQPKLTVTAGYLAAEREWNLYQLKDGRRDALLMTVRATPMDENGEPAPLQKDDDRSFMEVARSDSRKLVYEVCVTEEGQAYDMKKAIYNITVL